MPQAFDAKQSVHDRTVEQWVDYIQTLHHREIELSLDRVARVYKRLYPDGLTCKIISVAGTNGKGSTAEIIASIYHQAGYKVGKFSSPHLLDFTERYSLNSENVSEAALLDAFAKIEQVRADIPITYFEFGALLAIEIFSSAEVDVAVMEVGLGGRLDAINILDADVALITSISIDHTAWLGDTIELIAAEKAGIARTDKPCIVGMRTPANSIVNHCNAIKAQLHTVGQGFDFILGDDDQSWSWFSNETERQLSQIPLPFSQAGVQLSNAAIAIQAVDLLNESLAVTDHAIVSGIDKASILARCQIINDQPLTILDVAHNQASVKRLRQFVDRQITAKSIHNGKVYAVCGMLQDKEIQQSLACLFDLVDYWHLASINNERGADADHLHSQLVNVSKEEQNIDLTFDQANVTKHENVIKAYEKLSKMVTHDDILIVFGSFFVAGDILSFLNKQEKLNNKI